MREIYCFSEESNEERHKSLINLLRENNSMEMNF